MCEMIYIFGSSFT